MPIIIQDYKWKQTTEKILIQCPLHGVPPTKVDLFTSCQYLKASFESFFFEALLLHPVDIVESVCTKTSTEILFDLKKRSAENWETLEIQGLSKSEKIELKKRFIEEERVRLQNEHTEKVKRKAELKRIAVNAQIELDTKVRKNIEEIKKQEESSALGDLNQWKAEIEAPKRIKNKQNDLQAKIIEVDDDPVKDMTRFKKDGIVKRTLHLGQSKDKQNSLPKPRSTRSLQILFTAREFPTPCRESRLEEENEYLRNQAKARRSAGFVDEDLRPEEKNPQYLLAKGQEFLRSKNYLGAISAFSFGIKLSPKFLDLYLARSEAQFAIGNFQRTIEDCSTALDLLKPRLPINLDDRATCIGRRGISLFKLGFMKQGLAELEASLKLKKDCELENMLEDFKTEYEEVRIKQEKEKQQNQKPS